MTVKDLKGVGGMKRYDVIIIGAGAAGLMAADTAVGYGLKTLVIEKNEKAGKKLYITGKGRCNFTNVSDFDTVIENINTNSRFMYSSLRAFGNSDVVDHFESIGLKTKIERGNRAFPASDKASDVTAALLSNIKDRADILYNTRADDIIIDHGAVKGVICNGSSYGSDNVIVATGGLSYPSTGSTGDGYEFAKKAGHLVRECHPALVPLNIKGDTCKRLQGLPLKNIRIEVTLDNKKLYEQFGELLFTHFGVSGPVILSLTGTADPQIFLKSPVLHIDLKPALSKEELDKRLLRDFKENENRDFANCLSKLLPSKLIGVVVEKSGIRPDKKVNSVTKAERAGLLRVLKDFRLDIASVRGFEEAVITKGGVDVKELDPKTFGSKIVKGLYFAGETVDIDAMTGGYNLQIAWSSGHAAATAVYKRLKE